MSENGGMGDLPLKLMSGPPIRLSRHLYPRSMIQYGPAAKLVPGITIAQGSEDEEPMVLVFQLPDEEQHIFLLDSAGKQGLLGQLTGGVEIAHIIPPAPESDG